MNSVYNIWSIQQTIYLQTLRHIQLAHLMTVCDTTSSLYGIVKKKVLGVLKKGDLGALDTFHKIYSTHDDISQASEDLLLKLYSPMRISNMLNKLHRGMYTPVQK